MQSSITTISENPLNILSKVEKQRRCNHNLPKQIYYPCKDCPLVFSSTCPYSSVVQHEMIVKLKHNICPDCAGNLHRNDILKNCDLCNSSIPIEIH